MAGTSTLSGSGWTAAGQPRTDFDYAGVAFFTGQPPQGVGKPGDLSIDKAARKIYENQSGTWSAGTSY